MTALPPSPFLTSPAPTSQAVESAVAPNTPPCAAAGLSVNGNFPTTESPTKSPFGNNSRNIFPEPILSPGEVPALYLPGESDPSVTLDCAPGESYHAKEVFHYARKLGQTEALLGPEVTHAQWQGRSRHGAYPIDPEHRFILDEQSFIEACLKTDDRMPLFLAAPRKEYLAIMGVR